MIEIERTGQSARFTIFLSTVLITQVRHAFVEPTTFGKDAILMTDV
jgi:hypothetical protein